MKSFEGPKLRLTLFSESVGCLTVGRGKYFAISNTSRQRLLSSRTAGRCEDCLMPTIQSALPPTQHFLSHINLTESGINQSNEGRLVTTMNSPLLWTLLWMDLVSVHLRMRTPLWIHRITIDRRRVLMDLMLRDTVMVFLYLIHRQSRKLAVTVNCCLCCFHYDAFRGCKPKLNVVRYFLRIFSYHAATTRYKVLV